MVKGLEKFVKHFEGLEDAYVLIGGAACDVWLDVKALPFRVTKDLDLVIIVEGLSPEFFTRLWDFIRTGHYESLEQSAERPEFYRFMKPKDSSHPFMIELLTRNHLELPEGVHLTPIPADEDISSLSAILLNDDYYRYVVSTRVRINGIPVVPANCLIPLKARAWLDLTRRRDAGEKVKGDDIKKHRNDVFRLFRSLAASDRYALPVQLKSDLSAFLEKHPQESEDWQGIRQSVGTDELETPRVILDQLRTIFGLDDKKAD